MTLGTICTLGVLVLIVGLSIRKMYKDKKAGKSLQCGCDCSKTILFIDMITHGIMDLLNSSLDLTDDGTALCGYHLALDGQRFSVCGCCG